MLNFINKILKTAPAAPAAPAPNHDPRGIPHPALCLMVRHFMAHGSGGNPMGYRIATGLAGLSLWSRPELESLSEDSSLDLLEMAGGELSYFERLALNGDLEFEEEIERLFDEITSL